MHADSLRTRPSHMEGLVLRLYIARRLIPCVHVHENTKVCPEDAQQGAFRTWGVKRKEGVRYCTQEGQWFSLPWALCMVLDSPRGQIIIQESIYQPVRHDRSVTTHVQKRKTEEEEQQCLIDTGQVHHTEHTWRFEGIAHTCIRRPMPYK